MHRSSWLFAGSVFILLVGFGSAQVQVPQPQPGSATAAGAPAGELPETSPVTAEPPTFTPNADAAPAAAPKRVRVSGGVMAGMRVGGPDPVYPPSARAENLEGTVLLSALISQAGTVQNLQVVSGPPDLTGAALAAVKQWTYKPFQLNGRPVQVQTTVTVNFKLH